LNFFDSQDKARRTTRRLVFAYVLATVLIVLGVTAIVGIALFNFTETGYGITAGTFIQQQAPILIGTAVFATLFILGATAFKTAALSSGGGRVAVDMGGTLVPPDVQDPLRRRLRNIVEEMAIASGMKAASTLLPPATRRGMPSSLSPAARSNSWTGRNCRAS